MVKVICKSPRNFSVSLDTFSQDFEVPNPVQKFFQSKRKIYSTFNCTLSEFIVFAWKHNMRLVVGGTRPGIFSNFLVARSNLVTAKFGLHYIKVINHGKTINLQTVSADFSIKIIAISQAFFRYQFCQGKSRISSQNQPKCGTLQRYRRCCNVLILKQNCVSDTKCCATITKKVLRILMKNLEKFEFFETQEFSSLKLRNFLGTELDLGSYCGTFMTPFLASFKGLVTSDLGLVKHSALSFIF